MNAMIFASLSAPAGAQWLGWLTLGQVRIRVAKELGVRGEGDVVAASWPGDGAALALVHGP